MSSALLTTRVAASVIVGGVQRHEAVERLPPAYQRVLALLDAGRSETEIASELAVDESSVGWLIALAMLTLGFFQSGATVADTAQPAASGPSPRQSMGLANDAAAVEDALHGDGPAEDAGTVALEAAVGDGD